MSLEELMEVEVTSVSRKQQSLSETAAAVYVISSEDIRRSGATSLPDVLRMVPGLHVAQFNSNVWPVTARGFNGLLANKLLVLMDGRTLYAPIFSGVYWDAQETLLDNIDRIEVIRGPGGSTWGANAFNGVINIITKDAVDTQGGLVTALSGTHERFRGGGRYGGRLGENFFYRLYFTGFEIDAYESISGGNGASDWRQIRGGFRSDWTPTGQDAFMFSGEIYSGRSGVRQLLPAFSPAWFPSGTTDNFRPGLPSPYVDFQDVEREIDGGHFLSRWNHKSSDGDELQFQAYYDDTRNLNKILPFELKTLDFDFQHRFDLAPYQEITWGVEYRVVFMDTEAGSTTEFRHPTRTDHLWSGFIQDEFRFADGKWHLTIGTKIEHNEDTGWEVQPTVRLLRKWGEDFSLWAAVSRAIRTPSIGEVEAIVDSFVVPPHSSQKLPALVVFRGSDDFDSEKVWALELGFRGRPRARIFLDVATFLNFYKDLRSLEPSEPYVDLSPLPHVVLESEARNYLEGRAFGLEIAANWAVTDYWQIKAAYTFISMNLDLDRRSRDQASESIEDAMPRHQVSLRSSWNLPHNVELDAWFRYADEIESLNISDYFTLDLRLGWSPMPGLEIALVGRNLLDSAQEEYRQEILQLEPEKVERSFYAQVTWRF